jgi:hypothetical protein
MGVNNAYSFGSRYGHLKQNVTSGGEKAIMDQQDDDLEVVWGARGIARVIRRTPTQVHYLLKKGLIKAARKTGTRYHADVAGLREQFCTKTDQRTACRESPEIE